MKTWFKWALLASLLLSALSLTGCALVNVNPERDNAVVIATVDGEDIHKSEFNNYLALVQMNYEVSDQQWPTGHTLKQLKENIYDSIIQQKVFALKAQKDGDTIDEEAAKTDANDRYEQLWEEMGEDLFEHILEQNYTNNDSFKEWLTENTIESEYATKTTDKFQEEFEADPSKILDASVGTINGEEVTRGQYEYGLVGETLNYYMMNQAPLPSDAESMEETNKTIFEDIETVRANIKYCEDNDITIEQSAIDSAKESLSSMLGYFFQDDAQKDSFLESYYLTATSYDEYQAEQAKGQAAEEAIQDKAIEDAEVSETQIKNYYSKNQKEFDTTEVSAMHILTEDKDVADSIYDEAKDITDTAAFSALIDKYKDVDNIKEATDLGSFGYGTMVAEFEDAAFNADLDTVLKPVKTQYGYHVIFVYDRTDGEVKPLDEVRDEIETTLKDEKGQEDYDKIEEDLTKGVKYDIPDEILSPIEEYANELEDEYGVVRDLKAIRA